jgi:hypothetical protein
MVLITVQAMNTDWNSLPPTYRAISGSAASWSWKRHGREVGLDEVRHGDEHHAADQRGEEDRAGMVLPGRGFLRTGR